MKHDRCSRWLLATLLGDYHPARDNLETRRLLNNLEVNLKDHGNKRFKKRAGQNYVIYKFIKLIVKTLPWLPLNIKQFGAHKCTRL